MPSMERLVQSGAFVSQRWRHVGHRRSFRRRNARVAGSAARLLHCQVGDIMAVLLTMIRISM